MQWVWPRLGAVARRLMAVLAHLEGDNIDVRSLAILARAGGTSGGARAALAQLRRWHLVQEPLPGRFALHATVKYAVVVRTRVDPRRAVSYFVRLLEQNLERLDLEQTHLFAAMDFAHSTSDTWLALRLERPA